LLVGERQLVVIDGLAQIAQQRQALAAVPPLGSSHTATPQLLRWRAIAISARRRRRAFGAVFGKHRNADAGANVDDVTVKRHRQLERVQHGRGDALGIGDTASLAAAPRTRHRPAWRRGRSRCLRLQPRGDLAQQQIA
jgi:hypothetical protein